MRGKHQTGSDSTGLIRRGKSSMGKASSYTIPFRRRNAFCYRPLQKQFCNRAYVMTILTTSFEHCVKFKTGTNF